MQLTFLRQKYTSFICSLLLHILLLALFLVIKMNQRYIEEETPPMRTTPATVSFQPGPAQVAPQNMAGQQNAAATQNTGTPNKSEQNFDPIDADSSAEISRPGQVIDAQSKITEREALNSQNDLSSELDTIQANTAPIEENYTTMSDPNGWPVKHQTHGKSSGKQSSKRKSSISSAAFMNAFKQSVQTERQESYSSQPGGTSVAQQRLEDWAQAHYIQRIDRAIRQATLFPTKYIHLDEDIQKTVMLEIPIEKNGTLGKMADVITGIPAADEFIKSVLRSADLPPLPKRFNKDRFIYKVRFGVTLKKGTNYGRIHWNT